MQVNVITLEVKVAKAQEGLYFSTPFEVPENVQRIDIAYRYDRYASSETHGKSYRSEKNIIDLALSAPEGEYLGCSGADREHIWISEYTASTGYARVPIQAGRWEIILGAYRVEDAGVCVTYEISFTMRERTLLRGDLHVHTNGSDGDMSAAQTVCEAKRRGLRYVFLTDHNNYAQNENLPQDEDITVLPGLEWTHFKGHAGCLGKTKPYKGDYVANTTQEVRAKLCEAHENGALVILNHPFCPHCGWQWGFEGMPFDCVEIINGSVSAETNRKCLAWWQNELAHGNRLPVVGGSDYHYGGLCRAIGSPSTCVYAMSRSPSDILEALRRGHGYVTAQPDAPVLSMTCGESIMGDSVAAGSEPILIEISGLHLRDKIRVVTRSGCIREIGTGEEHAIRFSLLPERNEGFYRIEVYRNLFVVDAEIPVLLSNPMYVKGDFDEAD